jgi:hypothetical protein
MASLKKLTKKDQQWTLLSLVQCQILKLEEFPTLFPGDIEGILPHDVPLAPYLQLYRRRRYPAM